MATSSTCAGCGACSAPHACPVCLKLELPNGGFCSQECFKSNWAVHKLSHTAREAELEMQKKFDKFEFTGKLRPFQVAPRVAITDASIALPDYALTGVPVSELKRDKSNRIPLPSPAQIAALRESCRIARLALDVGGRLVQAGTTTAAIDRAVHEFVVGQGAYPSPLNYHGFPKAICTSINEVICHGIPDARPLEQGDIVNLDISVFFRGMHSDLNETFIVTTTTTTTTTTTIPASAVALIDKDNKRLVETAYATLMESIKLCKPGALYRSLGDAIQRIAGMNGCSVVKSYCGHGVGEFFHCAPNVPHYADNKAVGVMQEGHVFTIEPMINLGTWKDKRWPDDWTAVTADGKRSAQFEHTLLITKDGVEVLTARLPDSPSMGFDPDNLSIKK